MLNCSCIVIAWKQASSEIISKYSVLSFESFVLFSNDCFSTRIWLIPTTMRKRLDASTHFFGVPASRRFLSSTMVVKTKFQDPYIPLEQYRYFIWHTSKSHKGLQLWALLTFFLLFYSNYYLLSHECRSQLSSFTKFRSFSLDCKDKESMELKLIMKSLNY